MPDEASDGQSSTGVYEAENAAAVPRAEWNSFLDRFTKQHTGTLVNIVCRAPQEPIPEITLEGKLESIKADEMQDTVGTISVRLASPTGDKLEHTQPRVTQICLLLVARPSQERAAQVHRGLELVSGDGSGSTVVFRTLAALETIDGVIGAEVFQK